MDAMFGYFNIDFQKELQNLTQKADNPYITDLMQLLSTGSIVPLKLIQYGVDHLPEDPIQKEDAKLGTYFLIISELKDIPDEVRDFALDTMLYCEGSQGSQYTHTERLEFFEKNIKPLLL